MTRFGQVCRLVGLKILGVAAALILALVYTQCGGGVQPALSEVDPQVSVGVVPSTASIALGQSVQFTATVTNTSNTAVIWSVDGVAGGNATVGTISSSGLYHTPAGPGMHTIAAASQVDPTKNAQAALTVLYAGMFTYRNDLGRTGQNLSETTLTPANVNSAQFGKLFSYLVDGAIFAQPLYVSSVSVPGQGVHNVVYVATENDSVYAFDADGKQSTPLWKTSFINPAAGVTTVPPGDIQGSYAGGVTSTPVIDPVSGTLYVVAYTKSNGQYSYSLHALDLTTGKEKLGGPVVIQASVAGTGDASSQGKVNLDSLQQLQRLGLLLSNGVVYIGFSSHDDFPPYHGWLLGYDAHTLLQVSALNTTPNGSAGSIWESGCAPAADTNGDIYIATSNGTFDANSGGPDYGDTVLKLSSGNLSILDWFTPFNETYLSGTDLELGSGGTLLLPDQPGLHPHLLVIAGKQGSVYVIDRDNLGHFSPVSDGQIVQELLNAIGSNYSTPAYWHGSVYFLASEDNLKMFTLDNGLLSSSAVAVSPEVYGFAGDSPSISANGSSNGIVWVVSTGGVDIGGPAELYAYDATNVGVEFYNSTQVGSRDTPGVADQFVVPTVFNGKVYVGTRTELDVFGLLAR